MSKYNSCQGFEKISEALSCNLPRVHFVGVGGVGMYSLFLMTEKLGISVSGSDSKKNPLFEKLAHSGCSVSLGHCAKNVAGASLVVYSLAISKDNPEIRYAEELGITLVSRAEYLAYLLRDFNMKISVSGSHGKSSSTAMLGAVLNTAQKAPTVISGAALKPGGEPCVFASADCVVFEACEYKDSFLQFSPSISLFTNLELDHTDYFKSLDDIKRSFSAAMDLCRIAVVNCDDENLASIIKDKGEKVKSFGFSENADYRATELSSLGGFYSFSVVKGDSTLARINLSVPGKFSVYNALGVFAASTELGIPHETAAAALSSFRGIERRFEKIGERENGAPIIYDYAHHPSEISATVSALREMWQGEICVVFRAHTYSRTKDLWDGFVESLSLADRVLLCEVDPIRESEIVGVSAENLAKAIGKSATAISNAEIKEELKKSSCAVLIMGAADLDDIKNFILENNDGIRT